MTESEALINRVSEPLRRNPAERQADVLIIGPDVGFNQALAMLLTANGAETRIFSDDPDALNEAELSEAGPRSAIVELHGPQEHQLALLDKLKARFGQLPIVLITSQIAGDRQVDLTRGVGAVVLEKSSVSTYVNHRLHQLYGIEPKPSNSQTLESRTPTQIVYRQMTPDDAQREQDFVRALSASTRMARFFSEIKELSPQLLERFTHVKYPHSSAIIATVCENESETIIGVARYQILEQTTTAEFALVIADRWQRTGLGGRLLAGLIGIAVVAGLRQVIGFVQRDNEAMLRLATALGFVRSLSDDEPSVVRIRKLLR